MSGCSLDETRSEFCRNSGEASRLKLISIIVILAASAAGISSPVALARVFAGRPAYNHALLLIKCFAAGVILSTALVHVLPDAFAALADCQVAARHPWRDFPFSGLASLVGALLALLVDITASSHAAGEATSYVRIGVEELGKGEMRMEELADSVAIACHGHDREEDADAGLRGLGQECWNVIFSYKEEVLAKMKQRLVSQVLEIGIIFHSVIIGLTMGMSQNQCTIRPLVAALAFHQIFEGMGLGGCIAQAGFGVTTVGFMCLMFSVTTPIGILLGMLIFYLTGYDDSSPNSLILEGLLGSLSSGILLYMALVDLIAVDFFNNKTMSSTPRLKKISYVALVLGSASMSILALWA